MSISKVREAAKKCYLLMAEPLRPQLPPPSKLMAVGTLTVGKKKVLKKSFFFLNDKALMTLPLKKNDLFILFHFQAIMKLNALNARIRFD